MSKPSLNYRADIDGLRAIAIILVVTFHAFPEYVGGGFIGVDVFFVISGFLITKVITQNLKNGTFSFCEFYRHRIRRIFPALITILACCFAYSFFFLYWGEIQQVMLHIFGGAFFISNWLLWAESGYFDTPSKAKPLLHLWSLGIEEQFYIFWPVVVALIYRRKYVYLLCIMLLLALSFFNNLANLNQAPEYDFFSLPTRFWELLIGALVEFFTGLTCLAFLKRYANSASFVGIGCILIGATIIDNEVYYPGFLALLPTLGAALVIGAGQDAFANRALLSKRALRGVGLISYPLYLWHWPILSFLALRYGNISIPARLCAIAASFLLAWVTFEVIEKPIRIKGKVKTSVLICLLFILGVAGLVAHVKIFAFRPPSAQNEFIKTVADAGSALVRPECNFYDPLKDIARTHIAPTCYTPPAKRKKLVFLWGDSFAEHLWYGLNQSLPKDDAIMLVATSLCHPSLTSRFPDPHNSCNNANAFAIRKIAELKPDIVILSQSNKYSDMDWKKLALSLKAQGAKNVLLVGPLPKWDMVLDSLIARYYWPLIPERIYGHTLENDDAFLKKYYGNSSALTYVSVVDQWCNDSGCLATAATGNKREIITYDYDGHLTKEGSVYMATSILRPRLAKMLDMPDAK